MQGRYSREPFAIWIMSTGEVDANSPSSKANVSTDASRNNSHAPGETYVTVKFSATFAAVAVGAFDVARNAVGAGPGVSVYRNVDCPSLLKPLISKGIVKSFNG